ncbi:1,6-anhydro-N-acetylmuramyl-L-alanine amidase AmpD [Aliivibrio salmonicida]|jgi:AmpD protein|uniref:1,6-anhydro-N-acetylmuramyl-L-alanine amidase AmpD n=1 Tax=Aliivibrio salmonicida (strain LFI1238) TaxID=316275 RepID=B6ELF8_ALISL|nr:1,6-anhydro-N-acetylmuramyl-L-alanine amidase AmpD [Aliivibrio salmonicida]AZL85737.1 1,6-anhydro-N-acetylmuramyl-L-alanine amidase AmpD [Aliivibrio salmonicida]CAQ80311.1 AmpD protein (N-acetylmuramoyl-L-alanine amidase) [Aliivibrio salmonicida LFI1238]
MRFTLSTTHWINEAKHVVSPFYDERSDDLDISLLVVHNISLPPGQFGGPYIEQLFTGTLNPNEHPFFNVIHQFKVSAHCLIRRDGRVIQFVPFNSRAWHAGASSFAGRSKCNDYSIGIELEGTDSVAYTEEQYQSLASLTKVIQQHYPLVKDDRITGHQYIAPLRKTDPGLSFHWEKYNKLRK